MNDDQPPQYPVSGYAVGDTFEGTTSALPKCEPGYQWARVEACKYVYEAGYAVGDTFEGCEFEIPAAQPGYHWRPGPTHGQYIFTAGYTWGDIFDGPEHTLPECPPGFHWVDYADTPNTYE